MAAAAALTAVVVLGGVDDWSQAAIAGLGIAQLHVTGHRFTTDTAIFQALALDETATHFNFDGLAARQRLEQLPWVRSATIQRVFPDGLTIAISERTPYAVWRRTGLDSLVQETLVDGTGRELGTLSAGSEVGLPVVAGEGAGPRAPEILALVARYEPIAQRLAVAHRVADRRWRLELIGGTRIELPAEGAGAALARLVAQIPPDRLTQLLDGQLESIDLRTAEHIVVRRRLLVAPRAAGQAPTLGRGAKTPTFSTTRKAG